MSTRREMPGANVAQRVLRTLPFVTLVAVLGLLLLRAPSSLLRTEGGHMFAHVLASGLATFALCGVYLALTERKPKSFSIMLWGTTATVVLELLQYVMPSRTVEIGDVVDGLAGVLIMSLLLDVMFRSARVADVARTQSVTAVIGTVVFGAAFLIGPTAINSFFDSLGIRI